MKTLKNLLGVLACSALVVFGAHLLLSAYFVPDREATGNALTYAAAMLIAMSCWSLAAGFSRLNVLMSAKKMNCSAIFDRKFDAFKAYCGAQTKECSYIQRLLMYIFTFLIIAALVVKGSVAVAVLLTVAFGVSAGIKGFMRKVASGEIKSSDVFSAAV